MPPNPFFVTRYYGDVLGTTKEGEQRGFNGKRRANRERNINPKSEKCLGLSIFVWYPPPHKIKRKRSYTISYKHPLSRWQFQTPPPYS